MTPTDATTLATRLAEAACFCPVDAYTCEEAAARMLPLLQAQAVEDEKEAHAHRVIRIHDYEENAALRALVGRMKDELKQIAKDAGDNLDRSCVYTSVRIWKVAEDAKKCLGE